MRFLDIGLDDLSQNDIAFLVEELEDILQDAFDAEQEYLDSLDRVLRIFKNSLKILRDNQ